MTDKLPCWAKIVKQSARFDFFLFFDIIDSLTDKMISEARFQFPVRKRIYENAEYEYQMVFCQVSKKDSDRFIVVLDQLPNVMLSNGHWDYQAFCHGQLSKLKNMQRQA